MRGAACGGLPLGVGLFVAAMALTSLASAEPPNPAVTADALFREGRAAASRGDVAAAAKLFAESERLSPAPGTRLNLALAEERLGKLLPAWEHARSALDKLEPADERHRIAAELFARLDARVPRIKLVGELPPSARIELDGLALDGASLRVALPVAVGEHRVRVSKDGHADAQFRRTVAEGERADVLVAVGAPLPLAAKGAGTAPPVAPSRSAWPRTAAWIGVAVGGAALAASAVTGALALSRKGDVAAGCDDTGCDAAGLDAARSGKTLALTSTVAGITGAAFVAAGVTSLLVVPSPGAPSRGESFVGLRIPLR